MKIDFRKIEVKDIEGNNSTVDIAKELGNAIYNKTWANWNLRKKFINMAKWKQIQKRRKLYANTWKQDVFSPASKKVYLIYQTVLTMKNKKIMATKILSEKTRTTQVEAIAKEGEYQTTYSYNENGITRLQCCIIQKAKTDLGEQTVHAGYMALEGDSKSMNFPTGIDMVPHISMFENILREVNAGLTKQKYIKGY